MVKRSIDAACQTKKTVSTNAMFKKTGAKPKVDGERANEGAIKYYKVMKGSRAGNNRKQYNTRKQKEHPLTTAFSGPHCQ